MGKHKFSTLATGLGFTEGPVFRHSGGIVVTSMDRGHLYLVEPTGASVFAITGGTPNGATEGSDGAIYITQSPRRRRGLITGGIQVARPDDGSKSVSPYSTGAVVDYITLDVISPNDLCFGPDGLLWVTDPTRRPARDDSRIWRVDVELREAELVMSTGYYANGIAFGPEDDAVYVVSTGERRILRYPIVGSGVGKPETVVQMDHGHPDGFAFDIEGRIIVAVNGESGEQGDVQVWDSEGTLLEVIQPAEGRYFTNLAISPQGRMIVTHPDRGAVLETEWSCAGLALHPFRSAYVADRA
jgi:gluconolactonase